MADDFVVNMDERADLHGAVFSTNRSGSDNDPLFAHLLSGAPSADAVRDLVAAGSDPNARGTVVKSFMFGMPRHLQVFSPLDLAVRLCPARVVAALLEARADPAVRHDPHKLPPLHTAIEHRLESMVVLLLRAGADINAVAGGQFATPALTAAITAHCDAAALALIKARADVNARTALSDSTALHAAATRGSAELVAALLAAKADVHARRADGCTPLADTHGHGDAVRLLCAAGADADARLWDGTPILLHSLSVLSRGVDSAAAVEALLDYGACPRARGAQGESVLHLGVTPRLPAATFKRLMAAGADVAAADAEGRTALHLAASRGFGDALRALLSHAREQQ